MLIHPFFNPFTIVHIQTKLYTKQPSFYYTHPNNVSGYPISVLFYEIYNFVSVKPLLVIVDRSFININFYVKKELRFRYIREKIFVSFPLVFISQCAKHSGYPFIDIFTVFRWNILYILVLVLVLNVHNNKIVVSPVQYNFV